MPQSSCGGRCGQQRTTGRANLDPPLLMSQNRRDCRAVEPSSHGADQLVFSDSAPARGCDDSRTAAKRHVQWDGADTVMHEWTFWFLAGLRRRLYDSILLDSTQPWSPPASRDVVSRAEVGMTSGAVESRTATCTRLLLSLPTPATNTWPRRPHEAHLFPGRVVQRRARGRSACAGGGLCSGSKNLNAKIGERFRLVLKDVFRGR